MGGFSIHSLVQDAIGFIHQSMQIMKLNLLDYKVPSMTNLLALYKRLYIAFRDQIDEHTILSQAQR